MANLVDDALASLRRGLVILACVLGIVYADPGIEAAQALTFGWPVPSYFGVTSIHEQDSVITVSHERAHLFRTPNPGELKLSIEELGIWDFHVGQSRAGTGQTELSELVDLVARQPPMTLSADGTFERAAITEDLLSGMERMIRARVHDADPATLQRIKGMLRSSQMQSMLQDMAAQQWNEWAGLWIGLELGDGEAAAARMPLPWAGTTIESDVEVQNHGPAKPGSRLIRLTFTSRTGGEDACRAFERYTRELLSSAGAPVPPGKFLSAVRRTFWSTIVLEPSTMRPHYTESASLTELEDSSGVRRKYEAESCFFEWEPSPVGSRLDPVPPNGLTAYYENRLPEAYDSLRTEVENGTRNPDTYAYLAETCRRMDLLGQAALFARRALAFAPSHPFAHQILGDCYNDQYSQWPLADADSSWAHRQRAVESDSTDGNAWLGLCTESRRRGQYDLERRALTKLIDTGFLTHQMLAYARWMLQDLPESTVLVTNGDMDSYPPWSLQAKDRLRPDIAVVNYHLLNTPWYVRAAHGELHVPLPFRDAALDSLEPQFADSHIVWVSQQILRSWLDQKASGAFRRPLAIAVTIPDQDLPPDLLDSSTLIGSARLCGAGALSSNIDTTAVRSSLARLRADDFLGPAYSERDRSPVRRATSVRNNIFTVWMLYGDALGRAGRRRDARETLRGAYDFARKVGATPDITEAIREMQAFYAP